VVVVDVEHVLGFLRFYWTGRPSLRCTYYQNQVDRVNSIRFFCFYWWKTRSLQFNQSFICVRARQFAKPNKTSTQMVNKLTMGSDAQLAQLCGVGFGLWSEFASLSLGLCEITSAYIWRLRFTTTRLTDRRQAIDFLLLVSLLISRVWVKNSTTEQWENDNVGYTRNYKKVSYHWQTARRCRPVNDCDFLS